MRTEADNGEELNFQDQTQLQATAGRGIEGQAEATSKESTLNYEKRYPLEPGELPWVTIDQHNPKNRNSYYSSGTLKRSAMSLGRNKFITSNVRKDETAVMPGRKERGCDRDHDRLTKSRDSSNSSSNSNRVAEDRRCALVEIHQET
ncbi:MAG: hypothetical protein M1834_006400 [Cirrosporium novae-zelandiae]|nr:MAG: hypothetical protein M1834_006400 [Cirrosporium novae-zelandiae]